MCGHGHAARPTGMHMTLVRLAQAPFCLYCQLSARGSHPHMTSMLPYAPDSGANGEELGHCAQALDLHMDLLNGCGPTKALEAWHCRRRQRCRGR